MLSIFGLTTLHASFLEEKEKKKAPAKASKIRVRKVRQIDRYFIWSTSLKLIFHYVNGVVVVVHPRSPPSTLSFTINEFTYAVEYVSYIHNIIILIYTKYTRIIQKHSA